MTDSRKKFKIKVIIGIAFFMTVFLLVFFLILNSNDPQKLLNNETKNEVVSGYLENSDGFYIGDLSDGRITGYGEYVLLTGSSYSGDWDEEGRPDGYGVLVIPGLGTYEGKFDAGRRSDTGTFTWLNGDKYTGDWYNDKIHGNGILEYSNGAVLSGNFSNNTLSFGRFVTETDIGKITYTISSTRYEVLLELKDGTNYEGPVTDGKFNGTCIVEYANGDSYEGTLVDNKKSGSGVYTWANGASYVGKWFNDKMNGEGTYYYTKSSTYNRLVGEFKNNLPTETMTYYDSSGNKYTTTWSVGICVNVERE